MLLRQNASALNLKQTLNIFLRTYLHVGLNLKQRHSERVILNFHSLYWGVDKCRPRL